MLVKRKSDYTGITRVKEINCSEEEMNNWLEDNGLIQVHFPTLSDSDREFILSGITEDEWDDIFNEI